MTNYRLTIAYKGTRYKGWQSQINTPDTIHRKISDVLSKMDGRAVDLNGSGRTDAGVHAKGQVASVRMEHDFSPEEILSYCAKYLPRDIAVISAEKAGPRFHARLNAVEKCYRYRIWTSMTPNVFEEPFLSAVTEKLNLEAMKTAASYLTGEHDFRSFCGHAKADKSTVRTIYSIQFETSPNEIDIVYRGNGFLNHMVRILTGTLVEVGKGERKPEDMIRILKAEDRSAAGFLMPAEGLCLEWVKY